MVIYGKRMRAKETKKDMEYEENGMRYGLEQNWLWLDD